MNRAEFMERLTRALAGLPLEERNAALKYYEEYYEEAGPEREAEIVAELGAPEDVAASILKDYSSVPIVTNKAAYHRQEQQTSGAETAQSAYNAESEQADREKSQSGSQSQTADRWRMLLDRAERIMPIWAWIIIAVFIVPIAGGLLSAVVGLLGGVIGLIIGLLVAVMALIFAGFIFCGAIALAGIALVVGGLVAVVTGIVTFVVNPAQSMLTIGIGSVLISLGLLIGLLGYWVSVTLLPKCIVMIKDGYRYIINTVGNWLKRVRNER